jgi:hypothetical protein
MDVGDGAVHLFRRQDRENLSVKHLVCMFPQFCPEWYQSVGIDADYHWALLRHEFRTSDPRKPWAEVDIVMGHMVRLADIYGKVRPVWPPPTDYLVAVEAKCPKISQHDIEPWASPVSRTSELRKQLRTDIKLGFSRVSALHVIATPPDTESFGGAMHTANATGDYFLSRAEREVGEDLLSQVGHCVLSCGEVSWRPYLESGAISRLKIQDAPTGVIQSRSSEVRWNRFSVTLSRRGIGGLHTSKAQKSLGSRSRMSLLPW